MSEWCGRGGGQQAANGRVWLFRSAPGFVRPLADPSERGVSPRLSEALDRIEMIGQLRHGHLGAKTVVEGNDRFAMAAHLEVGRVRQGFSCTRFEEQASGLTGVDEPRPKFLVLGGCTARAAVLVADLVEPARVMALEQVDEGRRGLEIATAWLRSRASRADHGGPAAPETAPL
jgi:hypothetical protein